MTAHQKPGTPEGGLKVALNPIQWFASPDGFHDRSKGPGLEEVWRLIKEAGFGAVPAAIPTGVELETFKTLLDRLGLAAAPGYFAVPSPEQRVSAGEMLEDARIAAGRQAALGLQNMYIAIGMPPPDSVRLARPAVGAGRDQGRLDLLTDRIGRAAEAILGEGVKAAFHPHVGTWIETEDETRHVLAAVGDSLLGFGPDTGHLAWAGADVSRLFEDFRNRISTLHVKDIRLSVRDESLASGRSYAETVLAGLWAEPGTGDLDLDGLIAALGPGFAGWVIIEVDRPSVDPIASATLSARWAARIGGVTSA